MEASAIAGFISLSVMVFVCIILYISLVSQREGLREEDDAGKQLYPEGCCQNCGNPLPEDVKFCNKCGAKVADLVDLAGASCPNCGSTDLQAVVENKTSVSGGGYSLGRGCCGSIFLGPLGWLCGSGGRKVRSHSRNTHYWICKKCGTKFINREASGGWF
jgi:DNA-directed RNA polymerase subunit RPC12/RpoP